MKRALPPPVETGTKRSSSIALRIVQGRTITAKAASRATAGRRAPRSDRSRPRQAHQPANAAKRIENGRYSGRNSAVRPSRTPGAAYAQGLRPGSEAQRNASTKLASASSANGSDISRPAS